LKLLITGSSGFLGSELIKYLHNHEIVTIGRSKSDIICDLSKEVPVHNEVVDFVIHCAGKAHFIDKVHNHDSDFFNTNVSGTINLLKSLECLAKLPKSVVFISSVSVYGEIEGFNINEDSPLKAIDPYGLSKIIAEKAVFKWCNDNKVICTILRLPLVVGENPPGNLGSMFKGLRKGYYFNIAGGRAKKSMVLSKDVSKFILIAAEIGGIYNLTDNYHPSFAELSNHIAVQLGRKKPFNLPYWLAKLASLVGDIFGSVAPFNSNKLKKITSDLTFDDTKAKESFGWNPCSVLEGLKLSDNR
jgi:nucleoside-diphosphate-sugar epimerase